MTLENNRAPLLYYIKLCASFQSHQWIQTGVSLETLNSGVNQLFFFTGDLEIWQMTLENNRAPLLCCFKLCASFHSHQWIQTSYSPEMPNLGQNRWFFVQWDLEFDRWPWKTIGHLFYTTSSFLHHFKAISEFKAELQSGNAQFGSKSAIFCPVWPWNLTEDLEKQKGTSSMLLQALCIIS